ncbi:MAG TPA: hypothetical protein VF746_25310 [Longimicrobium sp.]
MSSTLLRFNTAIQTCPFDGAGVEPQTLCEVPRVDGSAARFVVPTRLAALLREFDGTRATDEVARAAEARGGLSAADVHKLVDGFLVPRGILAPVGAEAAPLPAKKADRLSYLTLRMRLLPPSVVTPLARLVGWTFSRPAFAAGLVLIAAAHLLFWLKLAPEHGLGFQQVRGPRFGAILGLMVASTFLHELGHAAAAAWLGCRRLEIGWGMYYYMTVLYTDLSEAWRLPRKQRALIDVGGIYFQALFAAALLGVFASTGSAVPLYVFLATDLAIASSLNPFFKMDGYWLMSDVLGIPNLHARTAGLPRWVFLRLFGRGRVRPEPLPLSRGALAVLLAYSGVGLAFFVFTFHFVFQRLLMAVAVTYPAALRGVWTALGPFHLVALGSALLSVSWRTLVLIGTVKFTYHFVVRLGSMLLGLARAARAVWREVRPRQAQASQRAG